MEAHCQAWRLPLHVWLLSLLPTTIFRPLADVQGILNTINGKPCSIDCDAQGNCKFDIQVCQRERLLVCAWRGLSPFRQACSCLELSNSPLSSLCRTSLSPLWPPARLPPAWCRALLLWKVGPICLGVQCGSRMHWFLKLLLVALPANFSLVRKPAHLLGGAFTNIACSGPPISRRLHHSRVTELRSSHRSGAAHGPCWPGRLPVPVPHQVGLQCA